MKKGTVELRQARSEVAGSNLLNKDVIRTKEKGVGQWVCALVLRREPATKRQCASAES